MEIILRIGQDELAISMEIDNPDTENIMYAMESLLDRVPGLEVDTVEEYILAWADEIKNKKLSLSSS